MGEKQRQSRAIDISLGLLKPKLLWAQLWAHRNGKDQHSVTKRVKTQCETLLSIGGTLEDLIPDSTSQKAIQVEGEVE